MPIAPRLQQAAPIRLDGLSHLFNVIFSAGIIPVAQSASSASRIPSQQPSNHSDECLSADDASEEDVDCQSRSDAQPASVDDCKDFAAPRRPVSPKMWTKQNQFPRGFIGANNYEMQNMLRAQSWSCPCRDRTNCLSADQIDLFVLYEHRRDFQHGAARLGGKRDAIRKILEQHYSSQTKEFSRSFVVGGRNDVCAAAMALACGVSVQTICDARADCTKQR
eukprot:6202801-Pleurochrysis_carterae.AAC.1